VAVFVYIVVYLAKNKKLYKLCATLNLLKTLRCCLKSATTVYYIDKSSTTTTTTKTIDQQSKYYKVFFKTGHPRTAKFNCNAKRVFGQKYRDKQLKKKHKGNDTDFKKKKYKAKTKTKKKTNATS